MKRLILSTAILFICLPLNAQERGPGPLGITPFSFDEPKSHYASPEEAKKIEASKKTWFEKQREIYSLSMKKSEAYEQSMANAYKRIADQVEWNRNYSLQRFIEVAKKAEEIANTIAAYGEHIILQKDSSFIRYYDGRPTDVFNLIEKDNYGNSRVVNTLNITYMDTDEFVPDNHTTTARTMEYVKLDYEIALGDIKYLKFEDADYQSNISDRPSAYTITQGAVEQTSELELLTDSGKALYDKLVNEIIPSIESSLDDTYTTETSFSNITYYSLAEDTASSDTPGGVYGEKKYYDYSFKSPVALDAPETGTVSDIQYYLLDSKQEEAPLDKYWWHAQNASLSNMHRGKEVREARSLSEGTRLGITRETYFYDAVYDEHNSLSGYKEVQSIGGQEIGRFYCHTVQRDSYGRQIAYVLEGESYGLSYRREYGGITYDTLSRVTAYELRETIDEVISYQKYWNMSYNNLWQLSDYFYSLDGVTHHRYSIKYNSYGFVESYTDVSIENGVTATIQRYNMYNANGLLREYTEYRLYEGDGTQEFHYLWTGNITYNSIYAVGSFDRVIIRDTDASGFSDYSSKLPVIMNSLVFDGITYTLNEIDMIALGFNSPQFEITTEKWRGLTYYSAGSFSGGPYYNFSLDEFSGRLNGYSGVTRDTTITSDTAELVVFIPT